jgi:hypothetical protein
MEKAKILSEHLKDMELPETVKAQAVMGAALGVHSDIIIKGMASSLSDIETRKAETENPQPELASDYSELEKAIAEMLTESTGTNICDSGGAYGRHWQENRQVTDFRKQPCTIIDIHAPKRYKSKEDGKRITIDSEISIQYNVFHYLTNNLELDDTTKQLQKLFDKYAKQPENNDVGYFALMEDFAKILCKKEFESQGSWNTYNNESLLSQGLQVVSIAKKDNDLDTYWILQIHNGCDVRGGYTRPRIFHVPNIEETIFSDHDASSMCECGWCNATTDDCGYHWYSCEGKKEFKKRLTFKRNPDRKAYGKDSVYCEKCKKPVEFMTGER